MSEQPQPGSIEGTVVHCLTGSLLGWPAGDGSLRSAYTDDFGRFHLQVIAPDEYKVFEKIELTAIPFAFDDLLLGAECCGDRTASDERETQRENRSFTRPRACRVNRAAMQLDKMANNR